MHPLMDLYAYNDWANAQVFATCRDVDQARLDEQAPGTYGTLSDTLKHLIQVEAVYLRMLREQPLASRESQAAQAEIRDFLAHDLPWFADLQAQIGRAYSDLVAHATDAWYAEPLPVPWFDFALTKQDGLLQVLSHSSQHRAQVFSVLGERGAVVPNIDYVFFLQSKLPSGA